MTENSAAHKRERKRWLPVVESGNGWCAELVCLKPSRWMDPTEPFDLAHDHVNGGYLGPSHFTCNRAEGAARGNRQRGREKAPEAQGVGRWRL